jgi:hypothetical protein
VAIRARILYEVEHLLIARAGIRRCRTDDAFGVPPLWSSAMKPQD